MNKKALTLLEIMVVVIIIGALATMAIVKYNTLIYEHRFDAIKRILGSVFAVSDVYLAQTGQFPQNEPPGPDWDDLDFLNSEFGLHIPPTWSFDYEYDSPGPTAFTVTGQGDPWCWEGNCHVSRIVIHNDSIDDSLDTYPPVLTRPIVSPLMCPTPCT